MNLTRIKSQLIMHKNYSKLRHDLINEIQETLLKKSKVDDFALLLKKVENEINQSIKK